jgi:hypothetical protein
MTAGFIAQLDDGVAPASAELRARLAQAVEITGRRAAAVAAKKGFSTIGHYLSGHSMIPFDAAAGLARAAGVSLDWLAYGDRPAQSSDSAFLETLVWRSAMAGRQASGPEFLDVCALISQVRGDLVFLRPHLSDPEIIDFYRLGARRGWVAPAQSARRSA